MRRLKARTHSVPSANSTNSSRRMPMSRVPRGPALAGDGTLSSRSSQSIGRSEIECSPVHDDKPLQRRGSFSSRQIGAGHSGAICGRPILASALGVGPARGTSLAAHQDLPPITSSVSFRLERAGNLCRGCDALQSHLLPRSVPAIERLIDVLSRRRKA